MPYFIVRWRELHVSETIVEAEDAETALENFYDWTPAFHHALQVEANAREDRAWGTTDLSYADVEEISPEEVMLQKAYEHVGDD